MKKIFTVLRFGYLPWGQVAKAAGIFLGACCISCSPDPAQRTGRYFAIDSVVTEQVKLLVDKRAATVKTAMLDGQEETKTVHPADTTAWLNELGVFRELKVMNNPTNRGRYAITDRIPDQKSNLTIKTVMVDTLAEDSDDLQVRSLKIYYHNTPDQIKKIEAVFQQKSWLYKSSRHLTLEFREAQQQPVLTAYSIRGGQKMFLADTVTFAVRGNITIPE